MKDVVVKKDWFNKLRLSDEDRKILFNRIISYGVFEESYDDSNDSDLLIYAWETVKGHIDRMQNNSEGKAIEGARGGRPGRGQDELIYIYKKQHPQCKVRELGEYYGWEPGVNKKGPFSWIYDRKGWKMATGKIEDTMSHLITENIPNSDYDQNSESENDPRSLVERLGF